MLLAVSDLVWQALIAGIVTLCLAWMQQRNKNAIDKNTSASTVAASEAAVKVDMVARHAREMAAAVQDVKDDLADASSATTQKLDTIHTLVNSRMGLQLKVAAVALRQVAELTVGQGRNASDVAAAEMAESLLAEHVAKQATVDARDGA